MLHHNTQKLTNEVSRPDCIRFAIVPRARGPALIEPEVLMPSQYLDRVLPEASLQPEKRLMLAVLENAVMDYQKYALSTSARGRRLFRECEEWLLQDHDGWVFSFDNICIALRLDADCVREGLQRWRQGMMTLDMAAAAGKRRAFRRIGGHRHRISDRAPWLRHSV